MKTKRRRLLVAVFAVLAVFSLAAVLVGCSKGPGGGLGPGKMPTFPCSFSADFVQSTVRGGAASPVMSGKTYSNCELNRMESRMNQPGAPAFTMITITRPDKGVTWQLFPKSMKYIERAIETREGEPPIYNPKNVKIDAEKIGEETVGGHPCVKWKVTVTMPDAKTSTYYSWGAQDLDNFEIKKEFEGTAPGESLVIEYSNVVLGDPDKSVFEIPAGYTIATESEMNALMMQEMGISIPFTIPPAGGQ
jgi:hypothetical protein